MSIEFANDLDLDVFITGPNSFQCKCNDSGFDTTSI